MKNKRRTTKRKMPPVVQIDVPPEVLKMAAKGKIEQDMKAYKMGRCTIQVGHSTYGWHMSIAHPGRYPTWDEVAEARYAVVPDDVIMVMVLPPPEQYLNVHESCFHLWQAVDGSALGGAQMLAMTGGFPDDGTR